MRLVILCCALIVSLWSLPPLASAESSESEPIPYKQEAAVPTGSMQRTAGIFLGVIAVSIGIVLLLRRQLLKRGLLGAGGSGERIVVAATRRIAPRLNVYLVHVDDLPYLIVQSGGDVTLAPHSTCDEP